MARLRYNLLETTLGAQLNAAATSITFAAKLTAADGDIPTIASPDYLPLTIGDEVVYLTAYTSEATTGTISRGEEGTTDATHSSGAAVENNPTALDFGMTSYLEDTDYELVQSQRFVGTTDPSSDGFDVADGDEWIIPGDFGCRVVHSTTQSIGNNTDVAVLFDTDEDDPEDMHDTSSNTSRITLPRAGWWIVGGGLGFASNATGYRQASILLNGTTPIALDLRPAVSGVATRIAISTLRYFDAGDYIELIARQNSGGSLSTEHVSGALPTLWARLR